MTTQSECRAEQPYLEQQRRGYRTLRFSRELEQEFLVFFREHCSSPVTVYVLSALVVMVASVAINELLFRPPPLLNTVFNVVVGGLMGGTLLASYIYITRFGSRYIPQIMGGMLISGALIMAGLRMLYAYHGVEYPFETGIFLSVTIFLLSGVRFRSAIYIALLIPALTLTADIYGGRSLYVIGQHLFNDITVALLAATGGYTEEYLARSNFLLDRINTARAEHDPLTDLLNRRGLQERFKRVLLQAERESRIVGVMVLDVDFFKLYNDKYGHPRGDDALRRVAELLGNRFGRRPLDCVARIGGEEFVLVWYDITSAIAQQLATECLTRIAGMEIPHEMSSFGRVTASVGCVVRFPNSGLTAPELLDRADKALYAAKEGGRNRAEVVLAVEPQTADVELPKAEDGVVVNQEEVPLTVRVRERRKPEYSLELATTAAHWDEAFAIRYRAYTRNGTLERNESKRFRDRYDDDVGARVFLLRKSNRSVASVRILGASSENMARLTSYESFSAEMIAFVGRNERVLEVNRLVVDPDHEAVLPRNHVIFLYKAMILCMHTDRAKSYFGAVREEHIRFYRRSFGMQPISESRNYPGLRMKTTLMAAHSWESYRVTRKRHPILELTRADVSSFEATQTIYF